MLFSIIIPVYNTEKYIGVLLQKIVTICDENVEVILINDGSTDLSGEICEEFASKYTYIKVYHQENKGASFARNKGIQIAKGEYILFFDSDDDINEDILRRLSEIVLNNNVNFVAFGCDVINNKGSITWKGSLGSLEGLVSSKELKGKFCQYAKNNELNSIYNKAFRRSIVQDNKICFPKMRFGEDAFFVCEYLEKLEGDCFVTKEVLYHYNIQSGSITHKYYKNRLIDEIVLIQKLKTCAEMFEADLIDKQELITIKYYYALLYEVYNLVSQGCDMSIGEKSRRICAISNISEINKAIIKIIDYEQFDFKKYIQWILLKNKLYMVLLLILSKGK